MTAVIVSVGEELVAGGVVDTNSAWLAGELSAAGVEVVGHVTVGDDAGRISSVVRGALERAGIVIVTGGLGPTADDLTRDGVAAALGVPLVRSAEAERQIRAFYAGLGRRVGAGVDRQAQVPRGCEVVANPVGTAPGFRWADGDRRLYVLPGVPFEMKDMFRRVVLPEVAAGAGRKSAVLRLVRTFGMVESKVGGLLGDMMAPERNPRVGVTASKAEITVRIQARGGSEGEATALAERDVAEVRSRLGDAVFGEGEASLASAVGALLRRDGRTVATAESCTGGLIAKMLTDVAGSSGYFLCGFVTYANAAKTAMLDVPPEVLARFGSVSAEVAERMADGCRQRSGADFAVAVTGIAGPGGGRPPDKPVGLVVFGCCDVQECYVREVRFGGHLAREQIRERAARTALNYLRLRLVRGRWGSWAPPAAGQGSDGGAAACGSGTKPG